MINVVCAIIQNEEKEYLLVQRSSKMAHAEQWEFAGGKIKEGETVAIAVQREIKEELGLEVAAITELTKVQWDYPDKKIVLVPVICEIRSGILKLLEHKAAVWASLDDLESLDVVEADRLIIDNLREDHEDNAS